MSYVRTSSTSPINSRLSPLKAAPKLWDLCSAKSSEGLLNEIHRGDVLMKSRMFKAGSAIKDKTIGFPIECRQNQSESSSDARIGGKSGLVAIKSATDVDSWLLETSL